jgi:hypothetical protein
MGPNYSGVPPGVFARNVSELTATSALVDLCLQHGPHVPRFNANHRQARFGENAVKPLRQRSGFQPNSLEAIDGVRQHLQESFRLTSSKLSTYHRLNRFIRGDHVSSLDIARTIMRAA